MWKTPLTKLKSKDTAAVIVNFCHGKIVAKSVHTNHGEHGDRELVWLIHILVGTMQSLRCLLFEAVLTAEQQVSRSGRFRGVGEERVDVVNILLEASGCIEKGLGLSGSKGSKT